MSESTVYHVLPSGEATVCEECGFILTNFSGIIDGESLFVQELKNQLRYCSHCGKMIQYINESSIIQEILWERHGNKPEFITRAESEVERIKSEYYKRIFRVTPEGAERWNRLVDSINRSGGVDRFVDSGFPADFFAKVGLD